MRKSIFFPERKEAIRTALMTADEGAVILIAGKGHEDYQIIGTTKIDYDERKYVGDLMAEI